MSETKLATKADLKEMYDRMIPYLGGSADAGFTPVGTVISVMGKIAPVNYLICDGTVYNIADYPELANYFLQQFEAKNYFGGDGTTTFAVPDLRGEFLRGTGTNSHENQGSGANVGEHQDATEVPLLYTQNNKLIFANTTKSDGVINYLNYDSTINKEKASNVRYLTSTNGWNDPNDNVRTVRPTNTSVLFCIATKNIYLNPSLDYSTDEKVVGTWIDGKPIYQKTIVTTMPTISTDNVTAYQEINITDLHVDKGINIFGFVSNGMMLNCAWQPDNGTIYNTRSQFDTNNTRIVVSCNRQSFSGLDVYVTIQYTKTTS